jgi:hypothetical protein
MEAYKSIIAGARVLFISPIANAAVFLALAEAWTPMVSAAPVLDQTSPLAGSSINAETSSIHWQQEVIAGMDGLLSSVAVYAGGAGTAGLYINTGAPWQSDASEFSAPLVAPDVGWVTIDTSAAGIHLSAGDPFVIGIDGADGGFWLGGNYVLPGGEYVPGALWMDSGGGPAPVDGLDLAFHTYMEEECYPDLPDPELVMLGWEDGTEYTTYFLSVVNWSDFPDVLFEPAPDLPPCGENPNASRTWVDIYREDHSRIYGHCGVYEAEGLTDIRFNLPIGTPPGCVYITLTDRRCGNVYTSNLVCMPLINVDIKPGTCPNPVNVKARGVLPVAILGTADFDVTTIDPASVRLEGVAPIRWALEDVATPVPPCPCGVA